MVDFIQRVFREIRHRSNQSASALQKCAKSKCDTRSLSSRRLSDFDDIDDNHGIPQLVISNEEEDENNNNGQSQSVSESSLSSSVDNTGWTKDDHYHHYHHHYHYHQRCNTSSFAVKRIIKKILATHPTLVHYQEESCRLPLAETKFAQETLHWHNQFRVRHSVSPLTLTNDLCKLAQDWANTLAHKDVFHHQNDEDLGENLFLRCSYLTDTPDITGEEVTKFWYAEHQNYFYTLDPSMLHTQANHFTQMVWKGSQELGVGKARNREGKVIVVAYYQPSGNVVGQFHLNVFPPIMDTEDLSDELASESLVRSSISGQSESQSNGSNHSSAEPIVSLTTKSDKF